MEILGRSSPINVIDTRTIRKDCSQMDGPSLPAKLPDPDKRDAPIVLSKASCSTSGNISHLLSLSTTQILAHAHQLLDPPLTDISAPEPTVPPEPNTLANPSISPNPKGQPFDALTALRYKKAANCVHPI